jgi:hypothetical protein
VTLGYGVAMRMVKAVLILIAVRSIAFADPPQSPPRPRECKPAGGVLFEVDQLADRRAKLTTATTRLYDNGSWRTEVVDADGKLARTQAGCLEGSQLGNIRADLRNAKWKTTRADVSCRADEPRFTVYKWNGRALYTERTCNVEVLDENSQHALELIGFYLKVPGDLDGGSRPRECLRNPLAKGCD